MGVGGTVRTTERRHAQEDVRSPEFAAEAHRQSLAVANCRYEQDDQDFIDANSDWSVVIPINQPTRRRRE
jgi:hypothetical protein